jgi:hypothetical protein
MLSLHEQTRHKPVPKVYAVDDLPEFWVAEGTDGSLYAVPKQPGGWMQNDPAPCSRFRDQPEKLQPLPTDEARSVVWFVYGDVGNVVIAEA